jgi:hypothetical protein
MDIELLYFDGCPSWQSALANLKIALNEEKMNAKIQMVKIDKPEQAVEQKFLGSPSIRIGNADLWSEEREDYFMGCRVYPTPEGLRGWPTIEMIREKLFNIKSQESGKV